jgi:hypothetical protein
MKLREIIEKARQLYQADNHPQPGYYANLHQCLYFSESDGQVCMCVVGGLVGVENARQLQQHHHSTPAALFAVGWRFTQPQPDYVRAVQQLIPEDLEPDLGGDFLNSLQLCHDNSIKQNPSDFNGFLTAFLKALDELEEEYADKLLS